MPPSGWNIFQGKDGGAGLNRGSQDKESLQGVKAVYSLKLQAKLLDFFIKSRTAYL